MGLASFPKWDMRTTTSAQEQKRNDLYGKCQESSNAPLPSHHAKKEKSGSFCFWVDMNTWCLGRREAPGATQMVPYQPSTQRLWFQGLWLGMQISTGILAYLWSTPFQIRCTPLTLQLNESVAVHTSKPRKFKLISNTPIKSLFPQHNQGTRPHHFVVQLACKKNKSLDNTSCVTRWWSCYSSVSWHSPLDTTERAMES